MCKRKFKKCDMRGFPLSRLNDALGVTDNIASIIATVVDEEESLLAGITEQDDDDAYDVVIESWMERLRQSYTVRFEEIFNQDVQSRGVGGEPENVVNEGVLLENGVNKGIPHGNSNWMDLFNTFKDEMQEKMNTRVGRFDGLEENQTIGSVYEDKG